MEGDIYVGDTTGLNRFQFMQFSVVTDVSARRWPNSIIPYVIGTGFTETERNSIIDAMNHIMARTKVRFVVRTNETDYVQYVNSTPEAIGFSGGYSSLGRVGGKQEVVLSANNFGMGLVVHELCHALGIYHEQMREDRNTYVEIDVAEIMDGFETEFRIKTRNASDIGSYDFASIMHYHPFAFARGSKPTIIKRSYPSDRSFGQSRELSAGDINAINTMYPTNAGDYVIPYTGAGIVQYELGIGESRTFDVYAARPWNFPSIFVRENQRFSFSVSSPEWNNGLRETTAAGYPIGFGDMPRVENRNMMALIGQTCHINKDESTCFTNTKFLVGSGRDSWTASSPSFLVFYANDNMMFYGDNSRKVVVTVTRTL